MPWSTEAALPLWKIFVCNKSQQKLDIEEAERRRFSSSSIRRADGVPKDMVQSIEVEDDVKEYISDSS